MSGYTACLLLGVVAMTQAPVPPTNVRATIGGPTTILVPGQNLSQAVALAPAGTAFLLRAGVYRQQTMRPKDGMTFMGDPGAILDGENVALYAFETLATLPVKVTIRGLTITRYKSPAQQGAIQGDNGRDWLIEDNEISYNAAHGVRTGISGFVVRRNHIHHNGVVGLAMYNPMGTLVEDNEIDHNPATAVAESAATAEASNVKMFLGQTTTFRRNNIHDGLRFGIWVDTASVNTIIIEDNRIVDQGGIGIWLENSWGATIQRNAIERCGLLRKFNAGWIEGGGIAVSNTEFAVIVGNTIRDSLNGIWGMQTTGYSPTRNLKNMRVEDNTIINSGQSGIVQNYGDQGVYSTWNNKFSGNTYTFAAGNTTPFRWQDRAMTEAQWKAAGQQ